MSEKSAPPSTIPADDPARLSLVDPDDPQLRHVAIVGDTCTIPSSDEREAFME